MTLPIFKIQSLRHIYAGKTVLEIDHLSVQPGTIVGLMGPNGSGKSTLLRLLGLLEKATEGTIYFNGQPVEPFSKNARFLITLLPQEPILMKRSVLKNVTYGLKLRGNRKNAADLAIQALSRVGLSAEEFARRGWYALSGGETQRVALAARLALSPKVLLLDEPTASVDAASAVQIKEAFLWARRELGTTIMIASHDSQWLYDICDEVVHLFRGELLKQANQTILFGPWHLLDSGKWGKVLSDNQELLITKPPHKNSVAIIEDLRISKNGLADESANTLVGTVSRLSLQRKTNRLFVTILAGDLTLTLTLSLKQSDASALFPGKKIYLHYLPERVKWI